MASLVTCYSLIAFLTSSYLFLLLAVYRREHDVGRGDPENAQWRVRLLPLQSRPPVALVLFCAAVVLTCVVALLSKAQ